jgi:hypothetical protein
MQDHRQNPNDPVALVVAVAVVEFLEMVEVRVAYGENLARRNAPLDFRFDRSAPGSLVDG